MLPPGSAVGHWMRPPRLRPAGSGAAVASVLRTLPAFAVPAAAAEAVGVVAPPGAAALALLAAGLLLLLEEQPTTPIAPRAAADSAPRRSSRRREMVEPARTVTLPRGAPFMPPLRARASCAPSGARSGRGWTTGRAKVEQWYPPC